MGLQRWGSDPKWHGRGGVENASFLLWAKPICYLMQDLENVCLFQLNGTELKQLCLCSYLNGGGDAYILFFINVILNICQDKFPYYILNTEWGSSMQVWGWIRWVSRTPQTIGEEFEFLCRLPPPPPMKVSGYFYPPFIFLLLLLSWTTETSVLQEDKMSLSFWKSPVKAVASDIEWPNSKMLCQSMFRGKTLKLVKLLWAAYRFYHLYHHQPWFSIQFL